MGGWLGGATASLVLHMDGQSSRRAGADGCCKGVEGSRDKEGVNSGQDAAGGSPDGFCSMASAALQAGGRDEGGGRRAARTNSRTREGRLDAWDRVWYGEI